MEATPYDVCSDECMMPWLHAGPKCVYVFSSYVGCAQATTYTHYVLCVYVLCVCVCLVCVYVLCVCVCLWLICRVRMSLVHI